MMNKADHRRRTSWLLPLFVLLAPVIILLILGPISYPLEPGMLEDDAGGQVVDRLDTLGVVLTCRSDAGCFVVPYEKRWPLNRYARTYFSEPEATFSPQKITVSNDWDEAECLVSEDGALTLNEVRPYAERWRVYVSVASWLLMLVSATVTATKKSRQA